MKLNSLQNISITNINKEAYFETYFTIDQQKAQNFVHFSECLYHHLPFHETQIINSVISSMISANHDKGSRF